MDDHKIELAAKQIIKKANEKGEIKTHAQAISEALEMSDEDVDRLVEQWLGEDWN